MCSNGPVVGIVPQRLLFETSLEKENNFINLPSSTAEDPKEHRGIRTYTTLRLEM